MARDSQAVKSSINFPGGSIRAPQATLQAIFGSETPTLQFDETSTIQRASHQRVRVIGGAATSVRATSYVTSAVPYRNSNSAGGGEPVKFLIGGEWWTVRLSGSHQDLNNFLTNAEWANGKDAYWRSEKNTEYGPFKASASTPVDPLPSN